MDTLHAHLADLLAGSARPADRCAAFSPAPTASCGQSSPPHHAGLSVNRCKIFSNTISGVPWLASTSISRWPAFRKNSISGRVCFSYASSRSRTTDSRSSSRITSASHPDRRFQVRAAAGNWSYTASRMRAHPSPGDPSNNYIVIDNEMNHHLVPSQLLKEAPSDPRPAAVSGDNHPG